MKHRSWLSGRSATGRRKRRAWSRTSVFGVSPKGDTVRAGGAAGVIRDHRRDNLAAEELLRIDDMEGNIQLFGDAAGEGDGVRGATAVLEFGFRVGPQTEHQP